MFFILPALATVAETAAAVTTTGIIAAGGTTSGLNLGAMGVMKELADNDS